MRTILLHFKKYFKILNEINIYCTFKAFFIYKKYSFFLNQNTFSQNNNYVKIMFVYRYK